MQPLSCRLCRALCLSVLAACGVLQVAERMKIVDVIGEKVYKDGERIITQVRAGRACPLSLPLGHFLRSAEAHRCPPRCMPSAAFARLSLASGICSFNVRFSHGRQTWGR